MAARKIERTLHKHELPNLGATSFDRLEWPMKYRAMTVILLGITIVVIGAASFSILRSRNRSTQDERFTLPTLIRRAEKASREGNQHVFFNAPEDEYAIPRNIKQALEYYDVVIAESIAKQAFAEDNNEFIRTWYRFRVLEYLHHRTIADCGTCPPALLPPTEMLSIDPDQILVPREGGDLVINGITLSSSDADFNAFEMSRKYVLFLTIDATKRVGTILAGPSGVYTLDSNNFLQPFRVKVSPLSEEIHSKFNNSLAGLTDYLRSQKAVPREPWTGLSEYYHSRYVHWVE